MYSIRTEFEFEASHKLDLPYESKCVNLHGHSYRAAATFQSLDGQLNDVGMIVDFTVIKKIIKEKIEDRLDHAYLNDIFEVNATAEYMSKWICDELNTALTEKKIDAKCVKVELNETTKNKAIWEEE